LRAIANHPLFLRSFRSFFLGSMLLAIAHMVTWFFFHLGHPLFDMPTPILWHSHGLTLDYPSGVIAGFLLTAVTEWTGRQGPKPRWLVILIAVWLIAMTMTFTSLPQIWTASFKLLFWLLFLFLLIPYIAGGKPRNYGFALLILILSLADVWYYYAIYAEKYQLARGGIHLGLGVVIVMITIILSRVLPFFTRRTLNKDAIQRTGVFSAIMIISIILYNILVPIQPRTLTISIGLILCAAGLATPLIWWLKTDVLRFPLLWILYIGYVWIIAGVLATSVSKMIGLSPMLSIHLLAIGGVGVTTLGMVTRISLGHTGHSIKADKSITMAFVLINLAVCSRVAAELLVQWYREAIIVAAILWTASFIIILMRLAPLLFTPKVQAKTST